MKIDNNLINYKNMDSVFEDFHKKNPITVNVDRVIEKRTTGQSSEKPKMNLLLKILKKIKWIKI